MVWSFARGTRGDGLKPGTGQRNPHAVLEAALELPDETLLVLLDFHPFLSDPGVIRQLKELGQGFEGARKHLLFLAPVLKLPIELAKDVVVVDVPLPDAALRAVSQALSASRPPTVSIDSATG